MRDECGSALPWRSESRTIREPSVDARSWRDRSFSRPPAEGRSGWNGDKDNVEKLGRGAEVQTGRGNSSQETDLEKGKPDKTAPPPTPPLPLHARYLPHPIPHFFGHRGPAHALPEHKRNIKPYPPLLPFVRHLPLALETWIWAWIGAFVGLALVQITFTRWREFSSSDNVVHTAWTSPVIVGSFGASSVLIYGAVESPLGQPRPFLGGQFLSALTGVIITKLVSLSPAFDLSRTDEPNSLVWLAGSLSVGTALAVMFMTNTVHPPGGATALLAATNQACYDLGWHYIPVVLLSSVIMLVWALLWMNLGRRRWPQWWWSPPPPPGAKPEDNKSLAKRAGIFAIWQRDWARNWSWAKRSGLKEGSGDPKKAMDAPGRGEGHVGQMAGRAADEEDPAQVMADTGDQAVSINMNGNENANAIANGGKAHPERLSKEEASIPSRADADAEGWFDDDDEDHRHQNEDDDANDNDPKLNLNSDRGRTPTGPGSLSGNATMSRRESVARGRRR